jgi:ribonuclease P protein component
VIFIFKGGFTVNRTFSIKKNEEIEKIIQNKNRVSDPYFVLYKQENLINTHFRFAVSVPKKFGDAVHRNQVKRRVRAVVDQKQFVKTMDFFLVVKAAANTLEYSEIAAGLEKLFARAKILEG